LIIRFQSSLQVCIFWTSV